MRRSEEHLFLVIAGAGACDGLPPSIGGLVSEMNDEKRVNI